MCTSWPNMVATRGLSNWANIGGGEKENLKCRHAGLRWCVWRPQTGHFLFWPYIVQTITTHFALLPLVIGPISILVNFSAPWGVYSCVCSCTQSYSGYNQTQQPSLPSQVLICTPGWWEASTLKCLAQGHKHHGHGQDSNPHSDDSAIRTWARRVESFFLIG